MLRRLFEWQQCSSSGSSGSFCFIIVGFEQQWPVDPDYQPIEMTTRLPVVEPGENGSGQTSEVMSAYDPYGKRILSRDPSGFITSYEYDLATGAVIRKVEDVDVRKSTRCPRIGRWWRRRGAFGDGLCGG